MSPAAAIARARARLATLAGDELLAKLARGGLTALIIKIGAAGLSFLMFLMLARAMSAEEYGRFGFGFSLAMFLSVIASLGLHTGILRWWPEFTAKKSPDKAVAVLVFGLLWSAIAAVGMAVALGLAIPVLGWSGMTGLDYLYAAALLIVPLTLSEYVASALRAQDSVVWALAAKDIIWRAGFVALAIYAISAAMGLSAGGVFLFAAAVLMGLVLLQLGRMFGGAGAPVWSVLTAKDGLELLRTALPMWGASVLFAFSQYVDVVLLGMFISPEEVGPYFAATRVANVLGLMLIAANMVAAPIISRLFHSDEHARMQQVLRMIAIGVTVPTLLAFGLIVAAGVPLLEIFGAGFSEAYVPLILLSAAFGFNAVCGPTGYLLQMTGHQRAYAQIMLVTYGFTLAIQLVLIPTIGTVGAAMGTLFGLVAWNLWARHLAVTKLQIDPTIFSLARS